MKMNRVKGYFKKFILVGVMFSMPASLVGCKLAKEEAESLIINDKLVGCYVTTEPVGNGKIYAKPVKVEDDLNYHYEYRFEDVEGIELYATTIIDREGGADYDITSYGEEVCSRETKFTSEQEAGISYEEVSGTIYYTSGETYFYMNPVYQEKDGDVYMVQTDMAQYTSGSGQMSQTLTGTVTYDEYGEKIGEAAQVTVTFINKQEPEKIKFIYMDADSKILKDEEYKPGEVPDEIKVMEGTEYILVESYGYDDVEGMDTVIRETYSELDGYIHTFMDDGKGFCVEKSTYMVWE